MRSRYWQFSIEDEDKHKTSFVFNNITYCYKLLPMGLKNSGDIFCRAMTSVLREAKNTENFKSFVDDLIIHAKEFDKYFETLKAIFTVLRKYNIRLNGSKSEFLFDKVKFLGRIINKEGFSADPENVSAVKELTPPRCKKRATSGPREIWLFKTIHIFQYRFNFI